MRQGPLTSLLVEPPPSPQDCFTTGVQHPFAIALGGYSPSACRPIVQIPTMPGPRFLDPHQTAKVKPITVERYRAAALLFVSWAEPRGLAPSCAEEWDDLLVEFKHSLGDKLPRAKFVQVITAVEFFFPRYRGQLGWAHAVVAGWTASSPIRHTVPLGKNPSKLIAMHFSSWGHCRIGVGIVVQSHTGLRPSELLGILPEHIALPEEQGYTLDIMPLSIALSPRTGTKVKRPQVALITKSNPELADLMRFLKFHTPPSCQIFPYTLPAYRALIKRAES